MIDLRSTIAIAQGRVDAMLAGRLDMVVAQRLAEDLAVVYNALRATPEPPDLSARIRDVRLLTIDGIGADLSGEFAQGDPFEPFDRIAVVKRITRVLDAARERARKASGLEQQPETGEP